jgi:hypothetical protein
MIPTEAAILEKLMRPRRARLNAEVARSLLDFKFDRQTIRHIRQLLRKNNRGTISAAERLVLEKHLRVGQFLDLLHAKARVSLQDNDRSYPKRVEHRRLLAARYRGKKPRRT